MITKDVSYFSRQERPTSNESGRSLIEMLGTIGIITMITVGAVTGVNTGMSLWKATQTHEEIMEVIQGITDMYSWNRNGWPNDTFDNAKLCEDGRFSSCNDANEMKFSLGERITIEGSQDGTVIAITITNIPYRSSQYLQRREDRYIITNTECVTGCEEGYLGAQTLRFTHDSNVLRNE